ncbi:RNA polymerase I specific transcription initiation factor RRN7, partial [Scheffersomyces stipitis CBS 6054]
MAPQSWFRGPVCGVDNCRSRLYRSSDGLTICQFGHVMEGNIEINDDQDQVTVTTRRLNVVNVDERGGYTSSPVVNSQKAISKKSTRLYGSEARELYFKCLQMLLKKQCEIFMTLFFSESMRDDLFQLVKTNWVKCLGITEKEEQVESKYYTVNTLDLISLIYISALQLRFQSIYINDIVKHIKSNEIPYVRTLHILPKSTLDKLPMPYHHMLQPLRLPSQLDLYHCIRINGLRLKVGKLDMPLNYYYPFAFKVFSDIFLFPNAIDLFNVFTNLMEAISLTELSFSFTYKTTVLGVIGFPEIQILGAIVFVIKLTFVSNPFKYMLHPKVWLDRLGKFEMNNEYSYIKSDNSDLLDWSDDKIEKYCDWIYDHIIPKKNKTYNLDGDHEDYLLTTMEKRLFQIFNVD